jgi:tetratricopeptide (TPR) repeat protein
MFLEKRVYQGSSGVVYPHPVVEKIFDQKEDRTYCALFLENKYLRIMVLPELGGRVQMAFDKIKQRHFIYYNRVIKPALVGLTGPWISGGIEFNWPQHHRPSTFDPIDFTIEENEDGSKTVWVNEVERMFHTKGMAGFTLYPEKAYLEVKGRLYNRTPLPQTFLWWANPAVKVGEHYQSVFPPDVHAVFDHGRRDVSEFPIAKGTYYKVNYAPGTDISRYKNIPVPTSYMAVSSKYNFIGGYEHNTRGGLLHVANHHIAPGKKQWTWGHGEFGVAWDRNLTDEDGPYIELMTGVFTDNQPDFSWIQPYEEKTFSQYFMPYSEVGLVKNATKEAALNVEINGPDIALKLYVTSAYEQVQIQVTDTTTRDTVAAVTFACAPESPFLQTVTTARVFPPEDLLFTVKDLKTGKTLVIYQKEKPAEVPLPSPAQAAKSPAETASTEELYLTGLHLEQYRHATYVAADYYTEALRRDPNDARNNNAMGLWLLRRGKPEAAVPYFQRAIATLTQRNPNPYDGEPYYNLGWALYYRGEYAAAFDAFYKSVWSDAWQHAGFLNLARIAVLQKNYEEALELVDKSLVRNWNSHTARHLKTLILRKLGHHEASLVFLEASLKIDPFNYGCLFEQYFIAQHNHPENAESCLNQLFELSRTWENNFTEYAWDYALAGAYDEAIAVLTLLESSGAAVSPLVFYYLGWYCHQANDPEKALRYFRRAAETAPDYCFPNRLEDVLALRTAMLYNPGDAKAPYYLGNFFYDKRQYPEAIQYWEQSVALADDFPTVHRNLALAYHNKQNNPSKALLSLEKAFSLRDDDARVLMELDQLYKKTNVPHPKRLDLLEKYRPLVEYRDDLYLERITLYNQLAEYQRAKELLDAYQFHPWEGGEGKVVGQFIICHLELAKRALQSGDPQTALDALHRAEHYPLNLGEGKLLNAQENDIYYLRGLALAQLGDHAAAQACFHRATEGISEPVQAIFYNDPQPDKIFYQGLAWRKLGDTTRANAIFQRLIDFGAAHFGDTIAIDYFAVSLPDLLVFDADLNVKNQIHCLYLQGLGHLGLGNTENAKEQFERALSLDINHQGCLVHRAMMDYDRLL